MWEARNTEGFFWATQAPGLERCVWEQAAWSEWATADGHAVATILCAHLKLVDAEVRTRFPMRQLKLLLPLYLAARHVEPGGVAREGAVGATRHHPGMCFRDDAPPAAAGGTAPGGESGASDGVVDRVTQELEGASTCMAAKLMQAVCDIATKKSQVLSNSNLCAGQAASTGAAAWRAGDADRTEPRNRLRVREASDHSGATGAAGEVQRTCQADQVPWRRRLAQNAHAPVSEANQDGLAVTGLNETQLQQSRSQMASCLAKRMHGKSATTVLMMAGDELDPVFDSVVIALTHALWDGWMPQATMAMCVRTAQLEQRINADRRERSVRLRPSNA